MEFDPFPNQKNPSFGGHAQLHEDRVDLHLALLEDLFFPHLGPRLWGMTEHLHKWIQTWAFNQPGAM